MRKPSTINLSLDAAVKKALQRIAFERRTSVSALITEWATAEASR